MQNNTNKELNIISHNFIKILCLFLLFIPTITFAQKNINVSGSVVDETGEPIIGVNVLIKGTNNGVITDLNGKFTFETSPESIIQFSYIGYQKFEAVASSVNKRIITLKEELKSLEELVVIGYGVQKKKEITGAVQNVSGVDIQKISASDIATTLQGRIAGVSVQASTGAPGDEASILIRGVGSIQGDNAPLYIVDGIPYDSDPKLNPYEILSVDVLKDAASAAVYGSRGANGVILITTKQGKTGEMKIGIDSYYGFQKITSNLPLMGTEDYLYAQTLLNLSSGSANSKDNVFLATQNYPQFMLNNTDWLREIQVDNAPVQSHNVQVTGGANNLTYSFTGGYFSQDGSLMNSGYERFNARSNVNFIKGNWTVQTNMSFNTDKKDNASWNLIYRAVDLFPYTPGLSNVDLSEVIHVTNSNEGASVGYQINSMKGKDYTISDVFNGNMKLTYKLSNQLSISVLGGAVFNNSTRTQINPLFTYYDNSTKKLQEGQPISKLTYSSTRRLNVINENVINYKFDISNHHHFNFTGLFSLQRTTNNYFSAARTDMVSNDLITLDATTGDPTVAGNAFATDIVSIMGRIQYNYKYRYLLSMSVRRDGSSKFSEENRWGTFPSVMGGWNVSNEPFWKKAPKSFSNLKLRLSYGETGSQNFPNYITAAVLTTNKNYIFGKESGDFLNIGTTQTTFVNENVKWETSVTKNFGFDMGLFNNALSFTADYYITDKNDMLFPVRLPDSSGGQADSGGDPIITMNVGNMVNKGFEFTTSYKFTHNDFGFDLSANIATNKNLVTYTRGTTLYLSSGAPVAVANASDYVTVVKEGYPVGSFFLIPTNGIIKTAEQLAGYKTATGKTNAQLGDLIYVDTNLDGVINDDDRVYSGSGIPDYELGFNIALTYKDFDFSTLWYSSIGNKIINGARIYAYTKQRHRDILYQWSTVNPDSNIPSARTLTHDNNRAYSDYWIEDGSYVRLRQITLGYSIPDKLLKSIKIDKLRVYLTSQNPLTFTKYTGFDPEVGNDGVGARGVDKGNYPVSSQYKVGLQLNF